VRRLRLPVNPATVRSYLIQSGFTYRKPEKKNLLDQEKRDRRLDFCQRMRTFRFKNSIIFSDETTIWLHDNSHCGWFHNNIKQELSINRHAGKINVWGAISVRGKVGITTFTDSKC